MDDQRAAGTPIRVEIGGEMRTFRRLSRRDVCALMAHMPDKHPTVFDFVHWASTPDGAVRVLALSAGVDEETAEGWGSMVRQSSVVGVIVAESVTLGDEQPSEDEQGPDPTQGGVTLQTRPSRSPETAPALETPGT